jgi:hypothetical protein
MLRRGWHKTQAREQHGLLNETQRRSRAREFQVLLAPGTELTQHNIMWCKKGSP